MDWSEGRDSSEVTDWRARTDWPPRGGRRGATLLELVVVVGIAGALLAVILPAVMVGREAARRSQCAHQLRQLGIGLHAFENLYGAFPPSAIRGPAPTEAHNWLRVPVGVDHSWTALVLPFVERGELWDQYDRSQDWRSGANRAVRETPWHLLICPSTPERVRWEQASAASGGWRAVAGDYAADYGIDPHIPHPSRIDASSSHAPQGALRINEANYFTRITDGLSQTLCLAEDAGRPFRYGPRRRPTGGTPISGAGWANPQAAFVTAGSSRSPGEPSTCPLNCSNDNEIYAFHPNGAQALFCDGAVRWLDESLELRLLARLITRAGGEVSGP